MENNEPIEILRTANGWIVMQQEHPGSARQWDQAHVFETMESLQEFIKNHYSGMEMKIVDHGSLEYKQILIDPCAKNHSKSIKNWPKKPHHGDVHGNRIWDKYSDDWITPDEFHALFGKRHVHRSLERSKNQHAADALKYMMNPRCHGKWSHFNLSQAGDIKLQPVNHTLPHLDPSIDPAKEIADEIDQAVIDDLDCAVSLVACEECGENLKHNPQCSKRFDDMNKRHRSFF